jgi:hypothetical protein
VFELEWLRRFAVALKPVPKGQFECRFAVALDPVPKGHLKVARYEVPGKCFLEAVRPASARDDRSLELARSHLRQRTEHFLSSLRDGRFFPPFPGTSYRATFIVAWADNALKEAKSTSPDPCLQSRWS